MNEQFRGQPEAAPLDSMFHLAIERSLDAIMVLCASYDASGEIEDFSIEYANARAEVQSFTPRDQLIGQHLCQVFPFIRSSGLLARYITVLKQQSPFEGEYFIPENEKMPGWYFHQVIPHGPCLIQINRDISFRKQMQASLRSGSNRFRRFVDESEDGITLVDDRGIVVVWNPGMERIVGIPRVEAIGRHAWELKARVVSGAKDPQMVEELAQTSLLIALRAGTADWLRKPHEREIQHTDGRLRIIQEVSFLIPTDHRHYLGAIVRDITSQKEMEAALRKSEANLRAMLSSTTQGFFLMGPDGVIWEANEMGQQHARQMLGRSLSVGDRLPAQEDSPAWNAILLVKESALRGETLERDVLLPTQKGLQVWFRLGGAPVRTGDNIIGVCVQVADITAQRERELRDLDLLLEREKLQVLESFISDASHDFRTPISVLKTVGYLMGKFSDQLYKQTVRMGGQIFNVTPQQLSAMLRDIGDITINIHKQIGSLDNSTRRLENLVESLLEITRLEHQTRFVTRPRNLNVLVDSHIEMLRPLAIEQQVSLHFRADDSLPFVAIDEEQLSRVVQNLIENAIQFTPEHGQVIVATYAEKDMAVLQVQDTGIGIAQADLPHIFERFYRADRARQTRAGGAGLGLSIAQRIVEGHRGRITVDSAVGVGSTFRVYLPISQPK